MRKKDEINALVERINKIRDTSRRMTVVREASRTSLPSKMFTSNTNYADENNAILRSQLAKLGQPVEHIPLAEIKAELAMIMVALYGGEECVEKRLDHLLLCLDWNKEYNLEEV